MEYKIHNIGELIECIQKIYDGQSLWFRGHGNEKNPLIPSVQRPEYVGREQLLANDFYMKASVTLREKPDFRSYSAWLSIMRHYGLPTRLLDWSRSPLIAAYFATEKWKTHSDMDGCIWVLRPGELNVHEGFENYLYSIDSHTATDMIRPAFKKEYIPKNPKVLDKILACYPIENNLRIYVQQSAFTLHNTLRRLDEISSDTLLTKLIIPGNCKMAIAEELHVLGITLSHIYPDSENIAEELKKKYRN